VTLTSSTAARPKRPGGTPSPLAVGVIVWLASELMFFAGLFAAYFTLRGYADVWPPDGVQLETARTAVATGVLLASSATMHRAVRGAEHSDRAEAARWLAVTAVLGAVFLGNQVWEYAEATFQMSSHAYGSMFYLMTGFHGLHVLGGILFMGATAYVAGRGSKAPAAPTVEVCAYYWHFVDVVWVGMFVTLYLIQ
jgi:cytochrome c oxidase subunit 3